MGKSSILKTLGKIKVDKKPSGKIEISKVYFYKCNGQMTVLLPKRKMGSIVPSKLEVRFWE